MKIKVKEIIPVKDEVRPKIDEIYDVIEIKLGQSKRRERRTLYFIKVNNEKVGVFENECEVVDTDGYEMLRKHAELF